MRLIALAKRNGLTSEQLANAVGVSVRSLSNIASGNSRNLRARRAITELLQTQIWPDVPLTSRVLVFRPGDTIESPTIAAAERIADALSDLAIRSGRRVRFDKALAVTVANEALKGRKII